MKTAILVERCGLPRLSRNGRLYRRPTGYPEQVLPLKREGDNRATSQALSRWATLPRPELAVWSASKFSSLVATSHQWLFWRLHRGRCFIKWRLSSRWTWFWGRRMQKVKVEILRKSTCLCRLTRTIWSTLLTSLRRRWPSHTVGIRGEYNEHLIHNKN